MSGTAANFVRSKRGRARTRAQQQVLVELALAAADDGRGAVRSYRQIAVPTKLHRNTVLAALRDLEREDRIRRHVGGREHCEHCASAGRTAVYDVVIPDEQRAPTGQMNLLADGTSARHNGVPSAVPSENGGRHTHGAINGTVAVPQGIKRTPEQQQPESAREQTNELAHTVDQVIEILGRVDKPGWYVDRIAIEAIVMTWSAHRDPLRAAAQVVAKALDHHHLNAARQLGRELEWQRIDAPGNGRGRFASASSPAGEQDFGKYDRALGLA